MGNHTGCYHIWHQALTGNAFFRWKPCYGSRQTANSAVRRWKEHPPAGKGHRPAPALDIYMVRQCDGAGACPCACQRPQV